MKYILSAVFVIAALSGCGAGNAWKQDPLADKDGAFQNGQQNPTTGEKPKVTPSDSVLLDTVDMYSFREGAPGDFKIESRILLPGYTPTIYIDNMADFPHANYDAVSKKFTWTPDIGTVSGDSGLEMKKPLKVHVVGTKPGAQVVTRSFTVDLRVSKVMNAPEIFSVTKTQPSMREGEIQTVTVKVRDKDAGNDVRSYPNLQILPITGYANLSQFVTITQVLATGNNEFVINLSIDLTDAELTKSRDNYGFTIKAVSRFQQASVGQDVKLVVTTSFADLQSTWFDTIEVPLGVKKEFQFMIFDPKDELFVATPTFSGLPSGATINCSGIGVTRQFCTFSWTPDFTASAGPVTITATATAKNQDQQDPMTKNYNFNLKLNVTSAPPVSPMALKGDQ